MDKNEIIYFLTGQGADERLFNKLNFTFNYTLHHIEYSIPNKGISMSDYAKILAKQIKTELPFILIGTSLGGMLATEISTFMSPKLTIVISSAKNRKELPFSYRFQKYIPIYKLVPAFLIKKGAAILQPLVEKDSKKERTIFQSMMQKKDPVFFKTNDRNDY